MANLDYQGFSRCNIAAFIRLSLRAGRSLYPSIGVSIALLMCAPQATHAGGLGTILGDMGAVANGMQTPPPYGYYAPAPNYFQPYAYPGAPQYQQFSFPNGRQVQCITTGMRTQCF